MKSLSWSNVLGIAGVLLLATMSHAAEPAGQPAPSAPEIQTPTAESTVTLDEYWIGVLCLPGLPDALRAQVGLPKHQGLLVQEVVPDGPGAKAGIEPMDVFVKVNGQPIGKVADLVAAVGNAKGKALSIELLRKGHSQVIKVAPAKRPAEYKAKRYSAVPEQPELEQVYRWFEQTHPGLSGKPPMRLRFFHPGMVLPPDAPIHPPLPDDMSVTIVKKGSELTRIMVRRGDETWNVTEKELDKLPPDVRSLVDRMLGGVVLSPEDAGARFDFLPDFAAPGQQAPSSDAQSALKARFDKMNQLEERLEERLEGRLEKMDQRIQRLQEMFEEQQTTGPDEKK